MQIVNRAKEVLTDPKQRREHDIETSDGSFNWIEQNMDVLLPAVLAGAFAVAAYGVLNWMFGSSNEESPMFSLKKDR